MDRRKNILNVCFLILVFIVTMFYVFSGQDMKELISYLKSSNMVYWFLSIVCVFGFIAGEAVIIFYMMKSIGQRVTLSHCFLYSFVGFFFSCVTPGATGGQPMQLYYMNKDKVPVSVGTLVLMIVTITYKMVLVVLGAIVFIFRFPVIWGYLQPVMGWCYLGMALNIFAVSSMLLLVFHPTLARTIVNLLMRVLSKFHIFRHMDKFSKKVDNVMIQYQDVSGYFRTHKRLVWNVFLITVVQRVLLFYVLYLTYRSFGLSGMSAPVAISLQGMIAVAADMLPLPGGMGITEKMFMSMFQPILKEMTLAVMVVSRGLSYYAELFISAVFTVVAYWKIGRVKK